MGFVSKRHLIIIALLVLGRWAAGAELSIFAAVDRNTVGLGEEITLTVKVEGEDMTSVPRPELPPLPDFDLLSQSQSSSTSVQIINGQISKKSSVNFNYILSAKRLGRLTIGSCILKYRGQEYRSQPIEIEVTKSSPAPPRSGGQAPSAPLPSGSSLEGNLFLSAVPDRRTVYVGEQVTVEYALYTRLRLGGLELAEAPSFSGFWSEKLYEASQVDFQPRTVDGKKYQAMVIKKVALFPMSAGEHQVGAMSLNVQVVQPPRDFFDFFGTTRNARISSREFSITALPLPEEGKPKEFGGGVGRFSLEASLDSNVISGSQPLTLRIKISGSGNLRMIDPPSLGSVPGLRIMEPEVKENIQISGGTVRGTKTFSYPIIAQADGRYQIPAVRMGFFDPKAKSYYTLEAGPFTCTATGCGQAAAAVAGQSTGLKVLATDIAHIKADRQTLPGAGLDLGRAGWAIYLFSLTVLGGSLAWRKHQERLARDRGYARRLRSKSLVRQRLRSSQQYLKKNDLKNFYGELYRAIMGYIGDRFNLDVGSLTREQLRQRLMTAGLEQVKTEELIGLIDQCEAVRFSPGSGRLEPQKLLEVTRRVLEGL